MYHPIRILRLSIRIVFSARRLYKNHYDVLNVKNDCTPKDIRDSFIRLSKQVGI